ncbi:serine/threonine-protein kinase [Actinomadura sp. SCN-SB]|uniref:serine/threonine-protein kinase n=1 Tax=Actinomadura sp. SCN-SB TaxID=3373092 RepID=UPI003752CCE5
MSERLLAGRYRLRERLGSGGMGTVWSAVDETLRRTVAVKEIAFPDGLTAEEREVATGRARREARAAALIDHPGVITVHDVVVEDDRPWIVMELVRGPSLDQVIRHDGPRVPPVAARIGLQVLDALEAAHARGIVHRDVKPGNVLLSEDGRVVLTDFGIAGIETDPALTRTGTLVGSPGYIAPERLQERPAGPESDLWSLAATLYTAVEGRPPFERDDPMAVLGAVLTEAPAPPRRAGSLAPLLWYLLQKDPAARPKAQDVRRVLENVAAGRPSGLPDPFPSPHGPSAKGRGKVWIPVAAGAAVIALIGAAVAVAIASSGDDDRGTAASASPSAAQARPPATPSPSASPSASTLDLCGLLTRAQVRRLLPNGTPRVEREKGQCGWGTTRRGFQIEDINLTVGDPSPSSPAEAHNTYVSRRNARKSGGSHVWGWPEIGVGPVRARQTPARAISGVGDEAFIYSSTGSSEAMDATYVVLRARNTVLEVSYMYERGTASPAATQQAARWVAQAVARRT